jgi:hypothetical protein
MRGASSVLASVTLGVLGVLGVLLLVGTLAACGNDGRGEKCPTGCSSCKAGQCLDCTAGVNACNGTRLVACNADGTFGGLVKECDPTVGCAAGACLSSCDRAAASQSYVACDYWPTITLNTALKPTFDFAVAVANPAVVGDVMQTVAANVSITRKGEVVATAVVAPGAVETITLPWVQNLSQYSMAPVSVRQQQGAYHLVSDIPVSAYQFNPLEFEKPSSIVCMDADSPGSGTCHSYTNDASMLIPTSTLRTEYIVIARGTQASAQKGDALYPSSGFFSAVATQDKTTLTVTYSAYTEAGSGIDPAAPGDVKTYTLDEGDVLQIISKRATTPCALTSSDFLSDFCDMGPQYDLTGTRIVGDKPFALFGGHDCANVPYDKRACDHLEEQMIPLTAWGKSSVQVGTEPNFMGEPTVWRVVSGTDGNMITFSPAVHDPITLDAGKYVEFQTLDPFVATATGRVMVGQYMVGANFADSFSLNQVSDPSLGLSVPVEQYRDNYDFLAPETYTRNYVNVTAPADATVELDGVPLTDWKAVGMTTWVYTRLPVAAGAHHMKGSMPFGITVDGIAAYTSYLYVGGLNLNQIDLQ